MNTMQVGTVPNSIKVSAGYGRLYVSGPAYRKAYALPGGTINEQRGCIELSLTLETLRSLRKSMGVTPEHFARFCTEDVLAWAKAAGQSEKYVSELHQKLDTGWRMDFPWEDAREGTLDSNGVAYPKREPYDHQKVMASVAVLLDGTGILGEMGTGKTRAGVEAMRFKLDRNLLDIQLIVCPKGVMPVWKREFALWAPHIDVEILKGSVRERGKRLKEWKRLPLQPRVLLLNYDVLYLLEADIRRLMEATRVGLAFDEGHRIRNPTAKVSKSAVKLATMADWRMVLTGTPVLQGPQDVWSQWYVVDLGIEFGANFVQYRREFLEEDPYTMKVKAKPGALEVIGNRMRKRGLRYTKADCLDLPPKVYETMGVEMTPNQRRAYREMEAELIALLSQESDEYATASNQLAAILRLTQITSGFVPDESGQIHRFVPNPKLQALEEIINEQVLFQKIIVWARYTEDICSIAEKFRHLNPLIVVGSGAEQKVKQRGINFPPREEVETKFLDPDHRLLVANPGAGGVGLNLQPASLAIYYSQGYSLEHRLQSEDRCHRGGSEVHNRVTYIDLQAEGTIDEIITAALLDKKSVAAAVVDLRQALGIE